MKKHQTVVKSRIVHVGFLNYRPHIQQDGSARVIAAYVSKAAAQRAYQDVRVARLVFDADGRSSMTDAKPVPDASGGTPPATPAHGPTLQEAQATISDHYGHGWLAGRDADRLAIAECRAEVTRLTQERDKWLHSFNASEQYQSGPTKRAEAAEARLTAQVEALEGLRIQFREDALRNATMEHEFTGSGLVESAARCAGRAEAYGRCAAVCWPCALRTPEGEK